MVVTMKDPKILTVWGCLLGCYTAEPPEDSLYEEGLFCGRKTINGLNGDADICGSKVYKKLTYTLAKSEVTNERNNNGR